MFFLRRRAVSPLGATDPALPPEYEEIIGRSQGRYRLMLVDDEEPLRRAVSEFLQQRGYDVNAHASAQEALDFLRQYAPDTPRSYLATGESYAGPDLIITDISMPGIDGYQFLKALRSGRPREKSIPVVFLTARGMTQDRIQAYRAGVNAYLSKPFDPEELVSLVDNVLMNYFKAEVTAAQAAAGAALTSRDGHIIAEAAPTPRDGGKDDTDRDILHDVRRELGDIKALLMADRLQKLGGGSPDTRNQRLLKGTHEPRFPADDVQSPVALLSSATEGDVGSLETHEIYTPPVALTPREEDVLKLLLQGFTNREIAMRVDLSVRSVEKYVSSMLAKTNTTNRTELVRYCMRQTPGSSY